jgi:diadenosine tetraphosphate (Ap4A) HIT family hydrolase
MERSQRSEELTVATGCEVCGFDLWLPLASLGVSELGLYSDSRFPGRSLLKLNGHWDSLEDLPDDVALEFLSDTRRSMAAIRRATGAERVNFAVLGNAVAHVHGHLIPRFPATESKPQSSPWDDPRPRTKLEGAQELELIGRIREELEQRYGRSE